eukprot:m.1374859 g.1374859  ORF g.1374859 m.1374859 type:complete len:150 (+) comp24960_c1_seq24:1089-1538(+)
MAWVPFASGTPGKTFYALECLSVGFGGKQLPDSCGSDVIVDTGTAVTQFATQTYNALGAAHGAVNCSSHDECAISFSFNGACVKIFGIAMCSNTMCELDTNQGSPSYSSQTILGYTALAQVRPQHWCLAGTVHRVVVSPQWSSGVGGGV